MPCALRFNAFSTFCVQLPTLTWTQFCHRKRFRTSVSAMAASRLPLTALRHWRTNNDETSTSIDRKGSHVAERLITVVETREFQRRAATRMSERERQDFIAFIAGSPENGALMRGTGGVRKSRWSAGARGKSGGVRVIYYYHSPDIPIFLLTVFAKNERDNLSQAERNILKPLTTDLVTTYRRGAAHERGTHRR